SAALALERGSAIREVNSLFLLGYGYQAVVCYQALFCKVVDLLSRSGLAQSCGFATQFGLL
ncbi:hypothetical protein U1Q18_015685, partial [Sarracenia purpurea var. burkii]